MERVELSDEVLIAGAAAGRQECWTALYRRYQQKVYRYVLHMSGSAVLAEEATQEAFVALVDRLDRFDAKRGALSSFLIGIARRKLLNLLEDEQGFVEIGDADFASGEKPVEDTLAEGIAQERLRQAIVTLPGAYREALVLCELEGMDHGEAATVLGCAVGTVKSRVHRAKRMLLERLSRKGCAV